MNKFILVVILILGIGLMTLGTQEAKAFPNQIPEYRLCWHGDVDNPFQDYLGMVLDTQSCPEYQHPPAPLSPQAAQKDHVEGDIRCQTTRLDATD